MYKKDWIFTIVVKTKRIIYKGEAFKVEVKYILLEGEYETIVKCWKIKVLKIKKFYYYAMLIKKINQKMA